MSQTTPTQEFQNENVQVSLTRVGGCRVQVQAKLAPASAKKAYDLAVKEVKREVSIPGFRRGKAPDSLIHERYKAHIEREWRDFASDLALQEATSLTQIAPARNAHNKATVKSLSLEEGAEILFELECLPELPQIDFSQIQINRTPVPAITDEMIDHFLSQLRIETSNAEFLEEGNVQEGDIVITQIENMEDPEHPVVVDNQRVFLFEETGVTPWVFQHFKGVPINGKIEETVALSDLLKGQPFDATLKPLPLRITVQKIARGNIPQIDDERAKAWGAENVAQLRERAGEQLKNSLESQVYTDHINQVVEIILQKYPFEIPESLLSEITKETLSETIGGLKAEGLEQTKINERLNEMRAAIRNKTERQMRLHYIIEEIIAKNKIEIQPHDLNLAYIRESFQKIQQGESPFEDEERMTAQERREHTHTELKSIESRMKRQAAYDIILSKVQWNESKLPQG